MFKYSLPLPAIVIISVISLGVIVSVFMLFTDGDSYTTPGQKRAARNLILQRMLFAIIGIAMIALAYFHISQMAK